MEDDCYIVNEPETRSARLLVEFERGEKGFGDGTVSYAIDDIGDSSMKSWTGSIFGPPNTVFQGRIYKIVLSCDEHYPEKPPSVRFHSRINMTCVNPQTGVVEPQNFPMLAKWSREYNMESVLMELKHEMGADHNKRLPQPAEYDAF